MFVTLLDRQLNVCTLPCHMTYFSTRPSTEWTWLVRDYDNWYVTPVFFFPEMNRDIRGKIWGRVGKCTTFCFMHSMWESVERTPWKLPKRCVPVHKFPYPDFFSKFYPDSWGIPPNFRSSSGLWHIPQKKKTLNILKIHIKISPACTPLHPFRWLLLHYLDSGENNQSPIIRIIQVWY